MLGRSLRQPTRSGTPEGQHPCRLTSRASGDFLPAGCYMYSVLDVHDVQCRHCRPGQSPELVSCPHWVVGDQQKQGSELHLLSDRACCITRSLRRCSASYRRMRALMLVSTMLSRNLGKAMRIWVGLGVLNSVLGPTHPPISCASLVCHVIAPLGANQHGNLTSSWLCQMLPVVNCFSFPRQ